MPDADGHKHAVVLSGGGAHGAFEVGVMKALFNGRCASTNHTPIEPDIYTGTSVGSYNATFLVSQSGKTCIEALEELETLWIERIAENPKQYGNGILRFRGDFLDFFNVQGLVNDPIRPFMQLADDTVYFSQDWYKRTVDFLFQSQEPIQRRTMELFDLSSLIVVQPLLKLIDETIDFDGIQKSDKLLRVIATNWETGEAQIFGNEHMTPRVGRKAVAASAAIPGIFPPVSVGDEPHVDGGVVMNTPLMPAIEAGADVIHMIYLDPDVRTIPFDRLRNTLDTMDRMLAVQFAVNINKDVEMINQVNRGLDVIEKASRGEILSDDDTRAFIQTASQIAEHQSEDTPLRKLTIHRYHPREDMGGALGLLNFKRERMKDLIERGYRFAVEHDPTVDSILANEIA